MPDTATHALLSIAVLLGLGSFVAVLARRLGIPDVVLFLLAGIVLGPAGAQLLDAPAASGFSQFALLLGASWLLYDGGARARLAMLRQAWTTIVVMATLGVLVTAAVTAFAAQWLLGIPLTMALLLGAVLAPTDSDTLAAIFRQVHVRDRVAQAVISEAAFNAATGAILTFVVLGLIMQSDAPPDRGDVALALVREAGIGIFVGALLGYFAAELVGHERRGVLAQFPPLAVLAGIAGSYGIASELHGSGFMAVFVFGLFFGNRESFGLRMSEPATHHLEEFMTTGALILRLMILMLLGAQVDLALMAQVAVPAILVVLVFMFVARPLAVLLCAAPDLRARWSWRELAFMCWTRETGVIPAALAGLLLGMDVPHGDILAMVTFIAIFVTSLVQVPTTRALARRLSLTA